MTWVNQIITAVESGGKVAWSVLLSCATALALEYFYPDLFIGLPDWVFPTIRIVAIFAFVLSVASISPPIINAIKAIGRYIIAPIKTRSTRKKLLHLHIFEVAILSKALAQSDRTIWAKPDLSTIISLQDSGLIRHFWCGAIPGDGTTSFEVPKEVWRVLLSMEEFRVSDPARLLVVLTPNNGQTEAAIIAALPQAHPAVSSRLRSETPSQ
ncbi:hypothetical protein [Sedimentitalea todarodis]|uniref:Uncharacterized protein n=1 Tax=Sedimentitalea todarodis TaxID=1631240 RepID=A0ABU3VL82_9RHOB|nr:hypothetical protein [Sedimentitalea todarodis]MDU9006868.1 hypothetical protein [Sedimentitalea todarodis]